MLRRHSVHIRIFVLWYNLRRGHVAVAFASVALDKETKQDEEEDYAERDGETDKYDEAEGEVVAW
jgi:hypothetical protein